MIKHGAKTRVVCFKERKKKARLCRHEEFWLIKGSEILQVPLPVLQQRIFITVHNRISNLPERRKMNIIRQVNTHYQC
jgi:hypothetical protein